jgi:hypothetical protein
MLGFLACAFANSPVEKKAMIAQKANVFNRIFVFMLVI